MTTNQPIPFDAIVDQIRDVRIADLDAWLNETFGRRENHWRDRAEFALCRVPDVVDRLARIVIEMREEAEQET